mmetsp:Transcript_9184/g.31901  ORF Transcript_9184/g.31901 Transcript_9184/m.31901 type:complete len:357 (+) Transcript_9184:38-1108(+)
MALWVDKYRPTSLDKLVLHKGLGAHLRKLVCEGDCPHMLFYGPSGAGKKTLVVGVLRELFGAGAEKLKVEAKEWRIDAGGRKVDVELTLLQSNHHIEMNPSDAGNKDRYVVQEVIKEMAKAQQVDAGGGRPYKVLVLNEVDRLSREAQHSLRRTMEKYSGSCRLLLVCNSASKVIDAVRSRCVNVRVPAPSEEQIRDELLPFVARKEGIVLPPDMAARVAAASERNMRRAVLSLEACKAVQYPFAEGQAVAAADWQLYVQQIASEVLAEQTPKRLYQVRGRLYELLINCIPPELVLRQLVQELMKKLDDEVKHEVAHWAAFYEHRLQCGQKPIFHLEAFVARFMSIYKKFMLAMFG